MIVLFRIINIKSKRKAVMKTLIWDLDGTLLDSYPLILDTLEAIYDKYNKEYDQQEVSDYILKYSTAKLLRELAKEQGIDYSIVKAEFSTLFKTKNDQIQLMKSATEVLQYALDNNIDNYVLTNKGNNSFELLDKLGINSYFKEVVSSESGFARKPVPDSVNYLVNKYDLDKSQTYYVGDRQVDVDTAINANIGSINLKIESSENNIKIKELDDIISLMNK